MAEVFTPSMISEQGDDQVAKDRFNWFMALPSRRSGSYLKGVD